MIPDRLPFFCCLLGSLVVMSLGCNSYRLEKPAKIRVGQFLFTHDSAFIEIYRDHDLIESISADCNDLTKYNNIPAGSYLVKIITGGQLILEKIIGFGPSGIYTLCLTGFPTKNQGVNKQSNIDKLSHMVEGADALTNNGFLPQLILQNDYAVNEPGRAKVRMVNLMPGMISVDSYFLKNSEENISFSDLLYPHTSDVKPLAPFKYNVKLQWNSSHVPYYMKQLIVKEGFLYTLYLLPSQTDYVTGPLVIIGRTKI